MRRRRGRRRLGTGIAILAAVVVIGAVSFWLLRRPRGEGSPSLVPPGVTVEVLNGCGEEGAADRVASLLRRRGFQVETVGNADHYHYRADLVVVRGGDGRLAAELSRLLGDVAVIEQRRTGFPVDYTVVVGTPHPLVPTP